MDLADNHDVYQRVIHLDDGQRPVRPRRADFKRWCRSQHTALQALHTPIAQSILYALVTRRLQSNRFAGAGRFLNNLRYG